MTVLRGAYALAASTVLITGCGGSDAPAASVTWGGTEGRPSCSYDDITGAAEAVLAVTGDPAPGEALTVTITAYADENTSEPVGSVTRRLDLDEVVGRSIPVAFEVDSPPLVDIDGAAACSLEVGR